MPQIDVRRKIARPPRELFNLVADIETYPSFLPGCVGAKIHERREGENGLFLVAELVFALKTLAALHLAPEERFLSSVVLSSENLVIEAEQMEGLFQHLRCQWFFEEKEGGCAVRCFLDFSFRSRFLHYLATPLLDYAVARAVAAFEEVAMQNAAGERQKH